jgi:Arc/MetJ-type ribon-helix-helix transcriptional regulator
LVVGHLLQPIDHLAVQTIALTDGGLLSLMRPESAWRSSRDRSDPDAPFRDETPLTLPYHPHTIHIDVVRMVEMIENVYQLRPKPSDSEKITINLGYVDLGHIDLMVQDGFYSNRTDFIRTAIRNQLERHADVVKQSTARKSLDLGLRNYSREDLEAVRHAGEKLEINVLGLATIAADVSPELARATIASVVVLGALHASPEVKAALADRTR